MRSRWEQGATSHARSLRRAAMVVALATFVGLLPAIADAQVPPPVEPASTMVLETTVNGDLVMAGNSNLSRAGGWGGRPAPTDVDGDATTLCIGRSGNRGASCTDNSSSAIVDVPPGASVLAARLYVMSSVSQSVGPLRVRLAGPGNPLAYTELSVDTPGVPKMGEVSGGRSGLLRQATWDVTEVVRRGGAGSYTVADIVNERAGPWLPLASWAMVVAYEFDDGGAVDLASLAPEVQQRFARRALSWHDGFELTADAPVEVEVGGFAVAAGAPVFAKSFHVVAHAGPAGFENVLFDGAPLGNNATPGDAPPPVGVVVGADPVCNSIVDVFNDSICVLGNPVAAKVPGPGEYRASADGVRPTSGSAVDIDVVRIPDRYLAAGKTSAVVSVHPIGSATVAPTMLAVSIDQPAVGP